MKTALYAACLSLITFVSFAQRIAEPQNTNPDWSKEYKPFRIVGNLYYVGTYDLACYLLTTSKGNILINTGLASSLPLIKANIETLGFRFTDIKILLTTQAHYDHMGAMAAIKKMTNAKLMADWKDAEAIADGGNSDYALGGNGSSYEPVMVDRLLHDQDIVTLGDVKLTMLHHPGHTKGSCSYLLDVNDGQKSYDVLIANLPSIVTDKNFSDIPAYPDVATDYANTFKSLENLQFDIWLSSHASQFNLHEKHQPEDAYDPSVFIDRKGFDEALRDLKIAFNKKLSESAK